MAPRTTTGVALTLHRASGRYTLVRPGHVTKIFDGIAEEGALTEITVQTNLGAGYWLRQTQNAATTTWTWVEL